MCDRLKPGPPRLLHGVAAATNLRLSKSHVKCAKVAGQVMGSRHPHGDSAIDNGRLFADWR
ncbi:DNA gyrase subunit A [Terrabacter sp. 2YAF2]|uniref:DNA gyrase subunit A n=1 Tax=Terrabacter sp. 2YAF2 TaxID=3233026 RepID=UPI003F9D5E31